MYGLIRERGGCQSRRNGLTQMRKRRSMSIARPVQAQGPCWACSRRAHGNRSYTQSA